MLPENREELTLSLEENDCSTGKLGSYENPLHIASASVTKLGITFAEERRGGLSILTEGTSLSL